MRNLSWQLILMGLFAWLALAGGTVSALAAEEDRKGPGDRLDVLERRVNELGQRQEQMMRRFSDFPEHQGPMPLHGPEGFQHPRQPTGPPAPIATKVLRDLGGMVKLAILVGIIFNILLAVWIYSDIRKRGEGSGIFIALALLAGVPAAIIYSIVRIGDKKA